MNTVFEGWRTRRRRRKRDRHGGESERESHREGEREREGEKREIHRKETMQKQAAENLIMNYLIPLDFDKANQDEP